VVGFDDIQSAAYINPALTTVRQPLTKMGETAARTLLDWIEGRAKYVPEIMIEPELVVRGSTAPPVGGVRGEGDAAGVAASRDEELLRPE
jgi:LacI family transcriptional regulator